MISNFFKIPPLTTVLGIEHCQIGAWDIHSSQWALTLQAKDRENLDCYRVLNCTTCFQLLSEDPGSHCPNRMKLDASSNVTKMFV